MTSHPLTSTHPQPRVATRHVEQCDRPLSPPPLPRVPLPQHLVPYPELFTRWSRPLDDSRPRPQALKTQAAQTNLVLSKTQAVQTEPDVSTTQATQTVTKMDAQAVTINMLAGLFICPSRARTRI